MTVDSRPTLTLKLDDCVDLAALGDLRGRQVLLELPMAAEDMQALLTLSKHDFEALAPLAHVHGPLAAYLDGAGRLTAAEAIVVNLATTGIERLTATDMARLAEKVPILRKLADSLLVPPKPFDLGKLVYRPETTPAYKNDQGEWIAEAQCGVLRLTKEDLALVSSAVFLPVGRTIQHGHEDEGAYAWAAYRNGKLLARHGRKGCVDIPHGLLADPRGLAQLLIETFPCQIPNPKTLSLAMQALRELAEELLKGQRLELLQDPNGGPAFILRSMKKRTRHSFGHSGWHVVDKRRLYVTRSGAIGAPSDLVTELRHPETHVSDLVSFDLEHPDPAAATVAWATVARGLDLMLDGHPAFSAKAKFFVTASALAPLLARHASSRVGIPMTRGTTGLGKTPALVAIMAHYMRDPSQDCLKGWTSTSNAIERACSIAGDQPVPIDDFKLSAVNRKGALQWVQNHADGTCKERLTREAARGVAYPPHGTAVLSGEDFLTNEPSATARLVLWDIQPDDIEPEVLFEDGLARYGDARAAMAVYIDWLAREGHFGDVLALVGKQEPAIRDRLREAMRRTPAHPRLVETMARHIALCVPFLYFATTVDELAGRPAVDHRETVLARWITTAAEMLDEQSVAVTDERLGKALVDSICGFIASGRVRVLGLLDGPKPGDTVVPLPGPPVLGAYVRETDVLYVNVNEAKQVFKDMQKDSGHSWPAYEKALKHEGFLAQREGDRNSIKSPRGLFTGRPRCWAIRGSMVDLAALRLVTEETGAVEEDTGDGHS